MSSARATLRVELHTSALSGMPLRPKNLVSALVHHSQDEGEEARDLATEEDFRNALSLAHSTDQLVELWRRHLIHWDYEKSPSWTATAPRTDERRTDILASLGLSAETAAALTSLVPVPPSGGPVVISGTFVPWYTPHSRQGRSWYWPAYRRLLSEKGWSDGAVTELDVATDQVVERLADPTSETAYQSKGLVVGYVQSGKTANFTGVIAKSVDAGYRLVIVLGGTLNLLREQTQRRLDMELVGRENILRGAPEYESDYADDPAWVQGKFLSHGNFPSALGGFDIVRMTTADNDYKSLLQGIVALEFEKQEPTLPLYTPKNLHRSSARLMVVKKNKTVLSKLVKDLNKIKTPLGEIPVLIIDDEADEASVNTANPNKPDVERTAINDKISELLRLLPRAQYVGYTATPFANVFIDPADAQDIFPKDFIVSLPRPEGYMGVEDFHDLDSPVAPSERTLTNSNEKAHVRDIKLVSDEDDTVLRNALDMFVLTAAMKLYREANGLGDRYFQHHTMLIHESVRTKDQRELRSKVHKLWWSAGYTGPSGHDRLRVLFDTDVAPVSRLRSEGQAVPDSYDELAPYVGAAAIRIGGDDQPVIVVNGDRDIENGEADFAKRSLWKILIGGQKLSRGFTIEGLTVSYYRRRAGNASTLMQMGRWFGFREGYRDLVRLYLGRGESMGSKEVDLYDAFESLCRDEESFREQLKQYATLVDGEPQITPADMPPLVSQHLSWLKPTSANKMYNARVVELGRPGKWEEPTWYPSETRQLRHNTELWLPIMESLSVETQEFAYFGEGEQSTHHRFNALTGILPATEFLAVLESLKWDASGRFEPHLTYVKEITRALPTKVDDWLVLAPQHASQGRRAGIGDLPRLLSWFARERRRGEALGAIRDPKHRAPALRIAGSLPYGGNDTTEHYVSDRRGVVVLYPVVLPDDRPHVEATQKVDPGKLVMAFAFVAPASAHTSDGKIVRFVVNTPPKDGPR
ncbi:Z1 domain-containing protein [Streptomyces tremellae]|uniref:Putative endonuclease Z1 domain-containing protein n=1 Tax=Streptomyces tremellae TaxID=1124239 RepID=A0ABP7FEH0_9ACTN